jgi:RNA polymerase sigma factor (sigma-70 family)
MADPTSLRTTQLCNWVQRIQNGDLTARDELIRAVHGRLERLAQKMLRNFPRGGRWQEPEDLLQNTLLRLLQSLEKIEIRSVREFFGLAGLIMRRELIDLARCCHRLEADFHSWPRHQSSDTSQHAFQPQDASADSGDLSIWSAFHEEVEKLPVVEREVVSLIFYHGYTQAEAAAILQFSERQLRRYWQTACARLHEALKGQLPEGGGL